MRCKYVMLKKNIEWERARAGRMRYGRFSALGKLMGGLEWYLLSPHFQLGLQLAAGILLTSLPVVVRCVGVGACVLVTWE